MSRLSIVLVYFVLHFDFWSLTSVLLWKLKQSSQKCDWRTHEVKEFNFLKVILFAVTWSEELISLGSSQIYILCPSDKI